MGESSSRQSRSSAFLLSSSRPEGAIRALLWSECGGSACFLEASRIRLPLVALARSKLLQLP